MEVEDFTSDNHFDVAIAISAVEHCGLGVYGEAPRPEGDHTIVRRLFQTLKPGGRLLLTVPYGRHGQTSWYRVYDKNSLRALLAEFKIPKIEFYIGMNRQDWMPTSEEEIARVDSAEHGFVQGVACVVALKP